MKLIKQEPQQHSDLLCQKDNENGEPIKIIHRELYITDNSGINNQKKKQYILLAITFCFGIFSLCLLLGGSSPSNQYLVDYTLRQKQINLLLADANKDSNKLIKSEQGSVQQAQKLQAIKKDIQKAIKLTQAINNIHSKQQKKSIKALQILESNKNYLIEKYKIEQYSNKQIGFCIIFPSPKHNKLGYYLNILQSIKQQQYSNYKIIYAPSQNLQSSYTIQKYLQKNQDLKKKSKKISSYNKHILNNIFFGIQDCSSGEIVIVINNLNNFVGKNVFNLYNTVFQQNNSLLMYTNYLKINYEEMKAQLPSVGQIVQQLLNPQSLTDHDDFDDIPMILFHADLFLAISSDRLTNTDEKFYQNAWNVALYSSLLQLSGDKRLFLNQITYAMNQTYIESEKQERNNINFIRQFQKIKKNPKLSPYKDDSYVKNMIKNINGNKKFELKSQKNNLSNKKEDKITQISMKRESQNDFKNNDAKFNIEQKLQKQQIQQQEIDQTQIKQNTVNEADKNIILSSKNKIQQEKVKQQQQIQILKNQNENQLKEAVLTEQPGDDRKVLNQPTLVKKQNILDGRLINPHQTVKQYLIDQKQHKPKNLIKPKSQAQQTKSKEVIINGNKGIKSTEVLPVDAQIGFIDEDLGQNQDEQEIVPIKPKKQINKKPFEPFDKKKYIAGRQDVKGPNYNYAQSVNNILQKTDFDSIFGKKKSKDGIWKNQLTQAIKKLQLTNNVGYGGIVDVQLTRFDTDKFQKTKRMNDLIREQTQYFQANYKISQFKKKQLPFCIVVPSYNNVQSGLYLRNLNSIFMQSYSNYHVVYIDDASQDKTGQYVKSYILSRQIPSQKIQIITNKQNRKPPYNIYNAITNHCKLGELALIVEGDDALIGTNVLNLYNAIYQKEKSAMIYSSYLDIYNNSKIDLGVGRQIMDEYFQKNNIRSIWQIPGRYLLSFYVDIFKSIKVEDFKDPNGYFFWFAYDRAFITPLLQVSYPRISIVKQILYEHRKDTGKNESPNDWNRQSGQILAKTPYKPLKFFPFIQRNKYKYFFDVPIQKVIQNSDFSAYNFDNNFQSEGITKDMHIRAIKMTQIVHNVNFQGKVVAQLAQYQGSKSQKQQRIKKLLQQDYQYYNNKYDIELYSKDQLPFCVVVPSYNNVKSGLYLRNLDSMFFQDYDNYHIVYIDDCSPDKTGDFVKKYLQQKKIPKQKIQVIINKVNRKALYNIHLAIHKYCKSGEIVIMIDGDDSFIGRNILSLYNAVYQRDNAAMAYSNFLTIHNNDRTQLGFCHDINKEIFEQNIFRNSWDLPGTHLMSFYSDLFKRIKISDLTYSNGTFYDYAYDRAILTPLLQMAYPRISVIKQITYQYRNDTGINDSPDDWIRVSHIILDKKPYSHLGQYPFIQGLVVSSDKFNFMTSIESVIKNSDFSMYAKMPNKKISGIAKEQQIHAIRLTQLVHNINFNGQVKVSIKSSKNPQKKKHRLTKLLKSDKQYIQAKYQVSKYRQNELPFCIVVSSYNNVKNGLYLRNLDSIFMQDYKNYKVVYIDDNSQDQAIEYIQKYVQQKQIPEKNIKVIINNQTRKQLANIYYSAHKECNLDDIMLIVGGNDALIGRNVLSILNALYQSKKGQVGFSCFLKVFNQSTQLGSCDDIDQFYMKTKTFRNRQTFQKYKLMSFYTHLFRMIKIQDLTFENGTFFTSAIDKAIMTPLIQMSYPNVLITKQIMYEYRSDQATIQNPDEISVTNLILRKDFYNRTNAFSYRSLANIE